MFGKAKCKLCHKVVRFAIRHLKKEHQQELINRKLEKLKKLVTQDSKKGNFRCRSFIIG